MRENAFVIIMAARHSLFQVAKFVGGEWLAKNAKNVKKPLEKFDFPVRVPRLGGKFCSSRLIG